MDVGDIRCSGGEAIGDVSAGEVGLGFLLGEVGTDRDLVDECRCKDLADDFELRRQRRYDSW